MLLKTEKLHLNMESADLLERNIRTMIEASSRKVREEAALQLQQTLSSGSLVPEQELSVLGAYLTRFRDPSEAMRLCVVEIVRGSFPNLNCLDAVLPRVIHEIYTILACTPVTEIEKSEVVRLLLLKLLLRVIHTCNEENPSLVESLSLFFKEITEILKAQMQDQAPENRIMINKCLFKLSKTYQKRSHLWGKEIIRDLTTAMLETYKHTVYTVRMTTVDTLCSIHLSPASEDIATLVAPYVPLLVTDSNLNVRRSVATMAAVWLDEHIDRHVYLDFFCGILLSLALDRDINKEVFDLFIACGDVYEREHKDDLRLSKELNQPPIIVSYNKFLQRVAPHSYLENVARLISGSESIESLESCRKVLRLGLGCRCLAERTAVKVIKAVLADITGSNDRYRSKACDMLAMLLITNEHNNIRYSPTILEQLISFFVGERIRNDMQEQLSRILDSVFSFLIPQEIICFILSFYRRSQLSVRQLGGLLTLIKQFIDLRTFFIREGIQYTVKEHNLDVGYVVKIINEILLKDNVLYSDDAYVQVRFKDAIYSTVKYLILLRKNSTTGEAFEASLQEVGEGKDISDVPDLLSKLTICIISAESKSIPDNAVAAALESPYGKVKHSGIDQRCRAPVTASDVDLNRYESETMTELLKVYLGKDYATNNVTSKYFTKSFELINLDPSSYDLEKRMSFLMRMMLSFISAGYQLPSEVEDTMRRLFVQLMRLTNKTDYSTSVRVAACRCIYLVISCLTRTLSMNDPNMRYFFAQILLVSTWQFGARTPECLEYFLRALASMASNLTTESFDLLCQAQKDCFGTLLGRIVSNLDADTPGCRIAALDILRGVYRYIDYIRTLELLYQLVQRVNDCVSSITVGSLYLCGDILSFHQEKAAEDSEKVTTPGRPTLLVIANRELLRLLVLHVDDSVSEISDACVTLLKQMRSMCTQLTCYNIKQLCEERLERCSRKARYTDLKALYEDVQSAPAADEEEMLLTREYEEEVAKREREHENMGKTLGCQDPTVLDTNTKNNK